MFHWQEDDGTALCHRIHALLDSGNHNTFEMSVAWVRRSGLDALDNWDSENNPLTDFISNGNTVRVTTGVGFQTSVEGLRVLLNIGAEVYVHHHDKVNRRGGNRLFHPKMYYFNGTEKVLLIGSNNLTKSGLRNNFEASIELNSKNNDNVQWQEIENYFVEMQTPSTPGNPTRTIHVDSEDVIQQLLNDGLIQSEKTISKNMRKAAHKGRSGNRRSNIFDAADILPPTTSSDVISAAARPPEPPESEPEPEPPEPEPEP
ncbi:MAG: hypothetical protein CL984_00005, partial [Euryarchaeota archaeon]|nr:hypothetical protein [Euryarchaeota archaeon]